MSSASNAEIQIAKKHNSAIEGLKNVALIGTVAVASLVGMNRLSQPDPKIEGDAKTYVAKPGDTEWSIAERAFPNLDPRSVIGYINAQEKTQSQRRDHTVVPGTEFHFADDAAIGVISEK